MQVCQDRFNQNRLTHGQVKTESQMLVVITGGLTSLNNLTQL